MYLRFINKFFYSYAGCNAGIKNATEHVSCILNVASPGIEPGSGASETLILSIVLRGRGLQNCRKTAVVPNLFNE